ncbi:hypothetical protein [Sporolactobacillus putidus]|uniref:Transcriptional regulator n=1 Tax=Sporolactobacillus putidus TaxID=492735 RepID=A0A917S4T7_9BACL|nr:hypothetical protein [Sporolactobacillus putidus]GGL58022.1 hypothetical protein GCM10007968_22520 [Sporolactobacillus putidus]
MKQQANKDIREAIERAAVTHWQVADAMGKSQYTLSIWLRKPLKGEKRELVLSAIKKAKREYGEDAE